MIRPWLRLAQAEQGADYFVLFLTGDGGWAQLDKELAQHFSAQGINVLGLILELFWRKRTLRKPPLISLSLLAPTKLNGRKTGGANRLFIRCGCIAFVLANLPKEQQTAVKHIVLLGLSRFAHFEFYLTNWLSSETRESPLLLRKR